MGEQDPIQPTLDPFANVSQQGGPDAFGAAGQGNTVCAPQNRNRDHVRDVLWAETFRDLTAQLPRQVRSHFESYFSYVFLKPVLFFILMVELDRGSANFTKRFEQLSCLVYR